VAAGYTQVTPATAYSVGQGYGWQPGNNAIGAVDTLSNGITNPDPNVTRDFNYTVGATFAVNVANGLYDVSLTVGDARGFGYSQAISFNGTATDTINTGGGMFPAVVTNTYVVAVNSGQLSVGLAAVSGSTYAVIDGLSFLPNMTPFAVSASSPANNGKVTGSLSQMPVTFNHPIGAGALTAANYTLSGPSGVVPVNGVSQINDETVSLAFAAALTSGAYSLVVGPGVTDATGASLATSTTINFTDVPYVPPTSFDFGAPKSPLAAGYTQVTAATAYNATQGYGWLSGTISTFDTGVTTYTTPAPNLTRDYAYTRFGSFGVNVADGTYAVTLILGDARAYSYTMNIFFQNGETPTDVVTTGGANPAVISKTYTVTVTNGQLDLGLTAGSDSYAVIDGLTIAPAN